MSQLTSLEASEPALANREYKVGSGTLKSTSIEPPKEKWPRQQVVAFVAMLAIVASAPRAEACSAPQIKVGNDSG